MPARRDDADRVWCINAVSVVVSARAREADNRYRRGGASGAGGSGGGSAVVVRWRSGIGGGGGPGQPPWQQVRPSSPERHATTSVWTAAKRTPRLNGYFAKAACPTITSPAL